MLVPYRHVPDYTDLTADEVAELGAFTQTAMRVIRVGERRARLQHRDEPGHGRRRRHRRPPAPARRAALGRRHQLHAGHRPDPRPAPGAERDAEAPRRGVAGPRSRGRPPSGRRDARRLRASGRGQGGRPGGRRPRAGRRHRRTWSPSPASSAPSPGRRCSSPGASCSGASVVVTVVGAARPARRRPGPGARRRFGVRRRPGLHLRPGRGRGHLRRPRLVVRRRGRQPAAGRCSPCSAWSSACSPPT